MGATDLWTKHVRNVNNSFPWVIGIGVVKVYRMTFDVLYPIDSGKYSIFKQSKSKLKLDSKDLVVGVFSNFDSYNVRM